MNPHAMARRRPSRPLTAARIFKALEAGGFRVSVHRMTGGVSLRGDPLPVPDQYVEMHAVGPGDPPMLFVARVEGSGPAVERRCACELARMYLVADG